MDFSAMYIKLLIFAVLLFLGYFMACKKLLTQEFNKSASALLVNVFIAASVLNSIIGERPDISNKAGLQALAISFLVTAIFHFIGWAVSQLFFKDRELRIQYEIIMALPNTLFIGLPIVSAISGSEAAFYIGISCVPFNVFLYIYGAWRLKKGKSGGEVHFKDMLSVCMIASVISVLLFLFNPTVPKAIKELISTTAGATVPISMIVIGASMGAINPVKAFENKQNYLVAAVRLIIVPVITYVVLRLVTDNQVLILALTVAAGCPVASVATPMSIKYGYNAENSAQSTMVTTALSMVTLPLLVKLLFT